ncbi:MAG: hypothetical protein QNJ68_08740 [Microcoleaceae cyanobacterium MO_207.B10]|nr:hypothetical protein [Microcoleaceae cyanobacterium MO_207.B10]
MVLQCRHLDRNQALLMRGYDLYLLAIAKLLNSNYSRLLSFYFHTLIQQRP